MICLPESWFPIGVVTDLQISTEIKVASSLLGMIWITIRLMFCKHLVHFAWLVLWREMEEAFSNCMNIAYTACLMSCATCGATYIQSTAGCKCPNTESREIASFLWNAILQTLIGMTKIWMSLIMAKLKCEEYLNRGYSPLQCFVFVILVIQLEFTTITLNDINAALKC